MKYLRLSLLILCLLFPPSLVLALKSAPLPAGAQTTVGPERVRAVLTDFIESKKDFLPKADVRFRSLRLPESFAVPAGEMDWEVLPSDPQILSSRRFTLILRVDGRVVKNFAIRGDLEAIAPVVVAAGDLRRGAILSARDLNVAELDLTALRNPCFDVAELIGKKLKRSARLGEPVDRQAVEFPPLIRRGDLVTISARKGGLTLSATGVARRDGKAGQTITVRNSSSHKDVQCRVVGAGAVEVEF